MTQTKQKQQQKQERKVKALNDKVKWDDWQSKEKNVEQPKDQGKDKQKKLQEKKQHRNTKQQLKGAFFRPFLSHLTTNGKQLQCSDYS